MNLENEKEVLILHEYLMNKESTVKNISAHLGFDIETVKRVLKKYISNLNVNHEDID